MKKSLSILWLVFLLGGTLWAQTNAVRHNSYNTRPSSMLFMAQKGQITDQHGQIRQDIDFKLSTPGRSMFIGNGKIEYQWITSEDAAITTTYRLDVSLADCNPDAKLQTGTPTGFKEHYYTSQAPATAAGYNRIVYKDIYPHIDWVIYIAEDHKLKYDFVVHAGGDPNRIKINYAGATDIQTDEKGNLIVTTPAGKISEKAPYSFVENEQGKQTIASSYVLQDNKLSFRVAPYQGTLTIDPEIDWATYYGGTTFGGDGSVTFVMNSVQKSATDNMGNVFIGGYTNAVDNIATTGAFMQELATNQDFFVAKFDNEGNRLWGTYYYGGAAWGPSMGSLEADHAGNVYFIGNSIAYHENFCTENAHQDTVSFNTDDYAPGIIPNQKMTGLVKLNASGERVWATYYGGLSPEHGWIIGKGLAVDNENNVFISGETSQMNALPFLGIDHIIATAGAYKEDITFTDASNRRDVFIAKFDSAGVRQWGTYYGGNDVEIPGASWGSADGGTGKHTATDGEGNFYIVGHTRSTEGISTAGSYQENLMLDNEYNSDEDAYIAKFSGSGELLWGTYYGGLKNESFVAIDLDSEGQLILFGNTASKNNIATPGAFQDTLAFDFGYSGFPFLAKFTADGERLWGTYFNDPAGPVGSWGLTPVNLTVDNYDNYWILFNTWGNSSFLTVGDQWDDFDPNGANSVLVKFRDNEILWSTYINGDLRTIDIDQLSNLYMAGDATENSYTSPDAFIDTLISQYGTPWLVKSTICDEHASAVTPSNFQPTQAICPEATVTFSVNPGFDTYIWSLPSGWTGSSDSNSIEVQVNDQSGMISVSGIYQCGTTEALSVSVELMDATPISFSVAGDTLYASGYDSYDWYFNEEPVTGASGTYIILDAAGVYKAVATTTEGCTLSASYEYDGTGLDELSVATVKVYPNPASSHLWIHSASILYYQLYDLSGKSLKQGQGSRVDLEGLADGMYLLQLKDKDGHMLKSMQFVKQAK